DFQVLGAVLRACEAGVLLQVDAADNLEEAVPLVVAGPRGVYEHVVVGTSGPAREHVARRREAQLAPVTESFGSATGDGLAGVGDPAVVDHRLLHGHLHPLPEPGSLTLVEGGQDPDSAVQARARVADGRPR